jgi:hypothetical protein
MEWQATVHQFFNDVKGRLSATISQTGVVKARFKGFYSASLKEPVLMNKGEDFFIRIRYSSISDTNLVPVERFVRKYATPTLALDRCWINPDEKRWPETWYKCGETIEYPALQFNLCIKAYFFSEE